jgi:hypothetical protein
VLNIIFEISGNPDPDKNTRFFNGFRIWLGFRVPNPYPYIPIIPEKLGIQPIPIPIKPGKTRYPKLTHTHKWVGYPVFLGLWV